MNFKKILFNASIILLDKIIQLLGIILIILGVLFLLSLISYSPEDPNFIFSENKEINNFLGFKGSFISDFFFQAIGLVSFFPKSFSINLLKDCTPSMSHFGTCGKKFLFASY